MKINWGTGLVIGMVAFISFILYLVINMLTDSRFDHDLVTEDYYKKELLYQQEIDAEENAFSLAENVSDARSENGWIITFPENLDPDKIDGKVSLYRPSDKRFDFEVPVQLSDYRMEIPKEKFIPGRWNISVSWKYEGKDYLYKKEIVF
ncbi:FixH family protein [Salegentibacter chungangensis]|uniref:FixH family protein n=1 Tax=Salegentibacter chungangensis TaxID=1335724 RepID=A0ABW3NTJ3_9FLAO